MSNEFTGSAAPGDKVADGVRAPKTLGIPPADKGALQVLQFAKGDAPDPDGAVGRAAAIVTGSKVVPSTQERFRRRAALSHGAELFLLDIVAQAPPGPERSTAISRLREALFWAQAAVEMEGR